jgi:hypothetical protein
MLLQLPEAVQLEVESGFINQTQIRELYSIYRASGTEAVYTAVKQLKDARLLGKKSMIIDPNKLSKEAVRIRTKSEIIVILEHLCDTVGVGLHTRCLAWASGEISTGDLYESIAKYAIKEGKTYIKPV